MKTPLSTLVIALCIFSLRSNAEQFKHLMDPKYLRHFVKEKERIGITTRAIVPDTVENRTFSEVVFEGTKKQYWPVLRHLPKEMFPYEAELTIYGKNKVSLTKLSKENVVGVIIEDDVIHGLMRTMFELAWPSANA